MPHKEARFGNNGITKGDDPMKKEKRDQSPLGVPTIDPPVPNRAHTEMKLPEKKEGKGVEAKKP